MGKLALWCPRQSLRNNGSDSVIGEDTLSLGTRKSGFYDAYKRVHTSPDFLFGQSDALQPAHFRVGPSGQYTGACSQLNQVQRSETKGTIIYCC